MRPGVDLVGAGSSAVQMPALCPGGPTGLQNPEQQPAAPAVPGHRRTRPGMHAGGIAAMPRNGGLPAPTVVSGSVAVTVLAGASVSTTGQPMADVSEPCGGRSMQGAVVASTENAVVSGNKSRIVDHGVHAGRGLDGLRPGRAASDDHVGALDTRRDVRQQQGHFGGSLVGVGGRVRHVRSDVAIHAAHAGITSARQRADQQQGATPKRNRHKSLNRVVDISSADIYTPPFQKNSKNSGEHKRKPRGMSAPVRHDTFRDGPACGAQ